MLDLSKMVVREAEGVKRKYTSGDETPPPEENTKNAGGAAVAETKKMCADCGTSKTPLWRGGPAGPKSLCNACGIRSRKKRRTAMGSGSEEKKGCGRSSGGQQGSRQLGDSLKRRLLELGKEVMTQRSTVEKQRRKLGEEEQAAVLLMALSYGSVYA